MEFTALLREEDAVSSAVGVVLMVATTIVLAAVIGTFVLGIGSDLTDPSPDVSFEWRENVTDDPGTPSTLMIFHSGGANFDKFDVEIAIGGQTAYVEGRPVDGYEVTQRWPATVRPRDRLELRDDGSGMQSGEVVRIFWSKGDEAAIVGEHRLG